jgi:hypothetical protein
MPQRPDNDDLPPATVHRRIMDTSEFIEADFDIHYIERMLKNDATATPRAAVV